MMEPAKRARLEAEGWRVGSAADFLDLTPDEAALIEIKLALSDSLRARRAQQVAQPNRTISTDALLERIGGDASLDMLIRAMLAEGATPKEIGGVIASVER